MSRIIKAGTYTIIVGILGFLAWLIIDHNDAQTKILIVHSYNKSMTWVSDIDQGIDRVENSPEAKKIRNLVVRRHYMNLLGKDNCNVRKKAATDVRFTIEDWKPQVIVIVDDIGQALIGFNQLSFKDGEAENRGVVAQAIADDINGACKENGPEYFDLDKPYTYDGAPMQIVFAGVNGGVGKYGYLMADNVSGIFEGKNYDALAETLLALKTAYEEKTDENGNPDGETIAGIMMLNEVSEVGRSENKKYDDFERWPLDASPAVSAKNIEEWMAAVDKANKENRMLLIANYNKVKALPTDSTDEATDASGTTKDAVPNMGTKELIQMTEAAAKFPVLGANTAFVSDGGMITVAISGIEQGATAMQLALKAIKDGKSDPEFRPAKQYLIGMNHGLFRHRGLNMPSIYKAFSSETGQSQEDVQDPVFDPELLEKLFVTRRVQEQ